MQHLPAPEVPDGVLGFRSVSWGTIAHTCSRKVHTDTEQDLYRLVWFRLLIVVHSKGAVELGKKKYDRKVSCWVGY